MFLVLKRTISFKYPQRMFWLRNKKNNFLVRTRVIGIHWSYIARSGLGSNHSTYLQRLDRILNKNGFVQPEMYLNMVSFLEMPLKNKFALKSVGKLFLPLHTV